MCASNREPAILALCRAEPTSYRCMMGALPLAKSAICKFPECAARFGGVILPDRQSPAEHE